MSLDYSFTAFRAGIRVGGMGSGAVDAFEVGADEVLI